MDDGDGVVDGCGYRLGGVSLGRGGALGPFDHARADSVAAFVLVFEDLGNRAVGGVGPDRVVRAGGGAAPGAQGGGERQPVGVDVSGDGGLVHQPAQRLVGDQVRVEFLVDAVGILRAQNLARAALVGLDGLEPGL